MRLSNIISLSVIGAGSALAQNTTTGQLGDATVTTGNPIGKSVKATLPDEPFFQTGSLNGNVKGYISAKSGANGVGVDYEVSFSNLPTEGGPFTYHLHVNPVPEDGNCTSTLAHLDPFIRGEEPPCDPTSPQTCQVGDQSGKYGKITSDPFTAQYHDDYTSLTEGVGSYFANRSFVIHFANKTRISCANFAILGNSSYPTNPTGGATPSSTPSSSPTTIPVSGGPSDLSVAKHFVVVPVMALLLML
ncbi:superoxide dismutase [Biscogniauxia mediterranea]|nr:superoxide dismutase [Biscogniauxia mediterranea]